MLNFYKMMFFLSMMIGTIISISSYSWMGMWLGLEINLLTIIPLISSSKNALNTEAALKYFITQAIASTLLLFTVIILSMNLMYNISMNNYFSLILNSSLLTKMGAAPFHFWFPEVMEGLSWFNGLIMLTWQKIAPMILLMYTNFTFFYLILIIITSMMISGIMGINQISLRKILAYSSINHIGWMIASMMFMESIWLYYFSIYSMISINIIMIFKMHNIFFLKQLFMIMNKNTLFKFFFILNFFSLGGLPPFLGFLPKWLTIQTLIQNNFYFISIIMILMTLMTLYFYLRITFSTLLLNMNELTYYKTPILNSLMTIMFNFIVLLSLIFCTLIFNII